MIHVQHARNQTNQINSHRNRTYIVSTVTFNNIKDAFEVYDSAKIRQKHILLVDDVYTTGATADECSKTLLSSGAERVDVLTLARAL